MVDIEQRALGAFKEDALARTPLAIEQRPHDIDEGKDLRRDLGELAHQRVLADLGHAQTAPQRVVVHEQAVDLGAQSAEVLEVLGADGAPSDLVLVGRADAAPGGADALLGGSRLAQLVELAMQRQDQRGVLGDLRLCGSISMPCPRPSISLTRCQGSSTTPLPMTLSLPGRTTPEGRSASL